MTRSFNSSCHSFTIAGVHRLLVNYLLFRVQLLGLVYGQLGYPYTWILIGGKLPTKNTLRALRAFQTWYFAFALSEIVGLHSTRFSSLHLLLPEAG